MKPRNITPQDIAILLRDMANAVEALDSFDGSIEYHINDSPEGMEAIACYRIGNSEGQGGMRTFGSEE
jgi:hypothetical protein